MSGGVGQAESRRQANAPREREQGMGPWGGEWGGHRLLSVEVGWAVGEGERVWDGAGGARLHPRSPGCRQRVLFCQGSNSIQWCFLFLFIYFFQWCFLKTHSGCCVENLKNSNNSRENTYDPTENPAEDLGGYLSKEDMQVITSCSASLVISEMQIKTTMSYHLLAVLVTQSCSTLCDPMDCSPPGFSVHGIFQARILECIAIPFSRGSSGPRDRTRVSCIASRFLTCEPKKAIIKNKTENSKGWWGCGEIGIFLHCWWECEMVKVLWVSQKVKCRIIMRPVWYCNMRRDINFGFHLFPQDQPLKPWDFLMRLQNSFCSS